MHLTDRGGRRRYSRHAGFTLVEVLSAVLVLTVGLLGLASLTLAGLRGSRTALHRTAATVLLADLGDRIRANRAGGVAYALAAGMALERPTLPCAAAGECSPAAMAALDLYTWQAEVLAALPAATTSVAVTPTGTPGLHSFEITLQWDQSDDAAPARTSMTVRT